MTHAVLTERTLDATELTASEAAAEGVARLDGLEPGEKMVLLSRDAGAGILEKLQAERAGNFEWSPVEVGPPVWRIEIERRTRPTTRREVLEALAWDHDRLDAIEAEAFHALEAGDLTTAFDLYARFAAGLRRHIGFEEEILFPEFEAASGMPSNAGPTAVMRAEHREIETLLEAIASGIGDAAGDVAALRARFHDVIGDHNVKEEQVLYPTTDYLLGAEAADRLVRKIQAYSGRPVRA
jgi:hemerythrin-like domain-containing protein